MLLSFPVKWSVVTGDAWHICCCSAKSRTSQATITDLGDIRVAHEHDGEFSLLTIAER